MEKLITNNSELTLNMPVPTCPKCKRVIPAEEINVANDLAYCRTCNLTYSLYELTLEADQLKVFRPDAPPAGVSVESSGSTTIIRAINRNLSLGVAMLLFGVFWNSLLSIFVAHAISATLYNLHCPLPSWLHLSPPRMNDNIMSWGNTLFLWLFLIPFILVGLGMAVAAVISFFGHTKLTLVDGQSSVFTGIGTIGWRRRFDTAQIVEVRLYQRRNNEGEDTHGILLALRSGRKIKFGTTLTPERQGFVLQTLRQRLKR